jgi:hypothetical protein
MFGHGHGGGGYGDDVSSADLGYDLAVGTNGLHVPPHEVTNILVSGDPAPTDLSARLKASVDKATAWVKANPALAVGGAAGVAALGYFAYQHYGR